MGINYVICAAGAGSRFRKEIPHLSKPLLSLGGRTMLEWSIDSLDLYPDDRLIVIGQKNDQLKNKASQLISDLYPYIDVRWFETDKLTRGQLETAYLAKDLFDPSKSIAIFNCDTFYKSKAFLRFHETTNVEGIIPCAQVPGESWSFCKIDKEFNVSEIKEKVRISDWATVGLYYFRDCKKFLDFSERRLAKELDQEQFVAPLYQDYIDKGEIVKVVPVDTFKPMGSFDQVKDFWGITQEKFIELHQLKKTLVVDLDNTITIEEKGVAYSDKKPNLEVIAKVKEYKELGYEIIINTARRMRTFKNDESKVLANIGETTIEWLKRHDVPFDGLKFGKPYAENGFYIDDKAIRPNEFVNLAVEEIDKIVGNEGS